MKTFKRDFNKEAGAAMAAAMEQNADKELTIRELAAIAAPTLDQGMLDGLRHEAVVAFLHRVIRSAKFKDEHGKKVRKFHSYKKFLQTEDGREQQIDIWRTIETMSPIQMTISAKARIAHSKDIIRSVANDVRWWDEHVAPGINADAIAPQFGIVFEDYPCVKLTGQPQPSPWPSCACACSVAAAGSSSSWTPARAYGGRRCTLHIQRKRNRSEPAIGNDAHEGIRVAGQFERNRHVVYET